MQNVLMIRQCTYIRTIQLENHYVLNTPLLESGQRAVDGYYKFNLSVPSGTQYCVLMITIRYRRISGPGPAPRVSILLRLESAA